MQEVEISQIDRRFESLRLKSRESEQSLLSSILEQGIREPLQCVFKPEGLILLDGFKRLRCALKLKIGFVPVVSAGSNEAEAILALLRLSNTKSLDILEQAALVDELSHSHGLSISEIGRRLECSPAWVSVRLGIIGQMSSVVKEAVFSGQLPVRSYMYVLRPFTRVKGIKDSEVDKFVNSVSGKGLSTRRIETLAHAFFRGGNNVKEQIRQGNLDWTLQQLRQARAKKAELVNELELNTLKELRLAHECLSRIPCQLKNGRLNSPEFFSRAQLLIEGILQKARFFVISLEKFYDQGREKESSSSSCCRGQKE